MSVLRPPIGYPEQEPGPETTSPDADQPDEAAIRRIPHLGHAALFFLLAFIAILIAEFALAELGRSPSIGRDGTILVPYPKSQLVSQGSAYLATLLAAWLVFPALWRRSFAQGIRWNARAARAQGLRLVGLGLSLGLMAAASNYFAAQPKDLPIDRFFAGASDAWLTTLFGIVLAPLAEEIAFRGFLLPAVASAYDWLSLPRTEAARLHWASTSSLSPSGVIFSAVLTSVLFALLHAQQVAHAWVALATIFSVSLVLTFVRVKTQSVACSAVVHGAYNAFVFLGVILATGGYRHLDRMPK